MSTDEELTITSSRLAKLEAGLLKMKNRISELEHEVKELKTDKHQFQLLKLEQFLDKHARTLLCWEHFSTPPSLISSPTTQSNPTSFHTISSITTHSILGDDIIDSNNNSNNDNSNDNNNNNNSNNNNNNDIPSGSSFFIEHIYLSSNFEETSFRSFIDMIKLRIE